MSRDTDTNIDDGVARAPNPPAHAAHSSQVIHPDDSSFDRRLSHADQMDTNVSVGAARSFPKLEGNSVHYEEDVRTREVGVEDGIDEEPMTARKLMIFVAMAFLWTGSQIPLYLFGGIATKIEESIGGADRYVWIALGNLIPLATVTPFVGAMSDLFGRRNIAMFAAVCGIVGSVVCSTAHTMNIFIAGQVIIGVGAGIGELTALAVAGESAPTKKRGLYVGSIIVTIVPYCPSVLYAQLISYYSTWRYIGAWTALWNLCALALTAIFYWPPPRLNSDGLSRWDMAKRLDYVGGILSAGGLTLFLAGLTWAGSQYAWSENHVKVSLSLGAALIVAFLVWEIWFVPYPMFPARLKQHPRALYVIGFITFVSGANFLNVLVFWTIQYYAVYTGNTTNPGPVLASLGSLPVGFCIIGGSIIFSFAVTALKGRIRLLMVLASVLMTAGNGIMAVADLNNLPQVYVAVTFACLGVGAVVVPCQIIATIICPDDLIATITAFTISIRIVGAAIGYAAFYHILRQEFIKAVPKYLFPVFLEIGVAPSDVLKITLELAGNIRTNIPNYPGVSSDWDVAAIIYAGRQCFVVAYRKVYLVSIAFGAAAVIAACFLPDISSLMDSHVAVQYGTAKEEAKEATAERGETAV